MIRRPPRSTRTTHSFPTRRSSDLGGCLGCDVRHLALCAALKENDLPLLETMVLTASLAPGQALFEEGDPVLHVYNVTAGTLRLFRLLSDGRRQIVGFGLAGDFVGLSAGGARSEEHTSELQSLMRISYAVFCLKKKN